MPQVRFWDTSIQNWDIGGGFRAENGVEGGKTVGE